MARLRYAGLFSIVVTVVWIVLFLALLFIVALCFIVIGDCGFSWFRLCVGGLAASVCWFRCYCLLGSV